MSEFSSPERVTRRTLAKGAAWTLPAIAMAAPAASASMSPPPPPPPPTFTWTAAYKNPGNSCTSVCVPKQSYGVPVVLQNLSNEDYQIQFTSYYLDTDPLTGDIETESINVGVFGVTAGVGDTTAECVALDTGCVSGCGTTDTPAGEEDYKTNSVCVPAGTNSLTVYVTSNDTGSSPNVPQRIDWRWVKKSDCTVTEEGFGFSETSPPTDVC